MRSGLSSILARSLMVLALFVVSLSAATTVIAGEAALGEKIYREGSLPSGQPLKATLRNGLPLSGAKAACASCHRRSGFGSSEGYMAIRPITGRYLFQPDQAPHPRLGRDPAAPRPALRPAYDAATLARALREGKGAAGRALDGMMPRYDMSDDDLGHLAAYLKTLGIAPDPGVTDTTLHFATVVDAAADPGERKAMLEVLEAFFRDKNAGTRLETQRSRRAPWDMAREYQAYRKWQLHQWVLNGAPETWNAQLEAYYRAQPVFAVLSGIGAGNWQPVHDFCERSELPCLFPNLNQPPQKPGQFALYFSRGLTLEAEALAVHLSREGGQVPVVQLYREDTAGAAAAFRKAIDTAGYQGTVADHLLPAGQTPDAGFWRTLASTQPAIWLLWLKPRDLDALPTPDTAPAELYLSASLVGPSFKPPQPAADIHLIYPYELPQRLAPRLQRLHAWLKLKGIPARSGPIQADTFFTVSQAGMALAHMVDDYSRDYFIERIEHGLDNALTPSAYPRPSLAPGQRYASKGSYIVRLDDSGSQMQAVGDWIVPDLLPAIRSGEPQE